MTGRWRICWSPILRAWLVQRPGGLTVSMHNTWADAQRATALLVKGHSRG